MSDDDDDDDFMFGGAFENGHWIWDEGNETLAYVSDLPAEVVEAKNAAQVKLPTGGIIEFRDDVDVIEQMRYRRRYQRKLLPGEAAVVTLQDVKDVALFTAPFNLLSPALINLLHLPTTERLLRALILYCQYFLQVAADMENRVLTMETKIRTELSDIVEEEFHENLSDLRMLVAKEYGILLMGGADVKKYHHMGPLKKRRSLSNKDSRLFQSLLRICVQIIWLALGRRCFDQIELEVNRLFKSEVFNDIEHNLHTNYLAEMTKLEKSILFGHYKRNEMKLYTMSPVMHKGSISRPVDYRVLGLGIIDYPKLTYRQQFLLMALNGPEEDLETFGFTLGIIGLQRAIFDTMLHPVKTAKERSSMSKAKSMKSAALGTASAASKATTDGAPSPCIQKLYTDIIIPEMEFGKSEDYYPDTFPEEPMAPRPCSDIQRRRWQTRLQRLLHPRGLQVLPPRSRDRAMYRELSFRSAKRGAMSSSDTVNTRRR